VIARGTTSALAVVVAFAVTLVGVLGATLTVEYVERETRSSTRVVPTLAVRTLAWRFTYYPDCAAVRAAGELSLVSDEPGYRFELDPDRDGVACET